MAVKWLFFDIDNTLFNTKELALKARKNAIEEMINAGLPAQDVDSAYEKLMEIVKKFGSNYGNHYNELIKEYGVDSEKSKLIAAGVVAYHNTKFEYLKPFTDVVPTLEKLREYKLGIISNGRAVKQWDKLIRLGLKDYFKVVVISEEVGIEKPDERIFKLALEKAGCEAEEAVMIGDKEEDLNPAKELGMKIICIGNQVDVDFKVEKFGEILDLVEKWK